MQDMSSSLSELMAHVKELEAQRKSQADEAQRIINSQRTTIERFKLENRQMQEDLSADTKASSLQCVLQEQSGLASFPFASFWGRPETSAFKRPWHCTLMPKRCYPGLCFSVTTSWMYGFVMHGAAINSTMQHATVRCLHARCAHAAACAANADARMLSADHPVRSARPKAAAGAEAAWPGRHIPAQGAGARRRGAGLRGWPCPHRMRADGAMHMGRLRHSQKTGC